MIGVVVEKLNDYIYLVYNNLAYQLISPKLKWNVSEFDFGFQYNENII